MVIIDLPAKVACDETGCHRSRACKVILMATGGVEASLHEVFPPAGSIVAPGTPPPVPQKLIRGLIHNGVLGFKSIEGWLFLPGPNGEFRCICPVHAESFKARVAAQSGGAP